MSAAERTDLARIEAFTDAVMAVAITLLVLNIELPALREGERLEDALVDLLPSLGAYFLSFALVGRFWVIHHNAFERLRAFDSALMGLNLLYLALIVLIPFGADLVDRHGDESIAAAVFGLLLGLASLVNWYMHVHALRAGLVKEARRDETAPFGSPVALGFTVIFLASVPLAFVSPYLAEAVWALTLVLRYPLRRLAGRASSS